MSSRPVFCAIRYSGRIAATTGSIFVDRKKNSTSVHLRTGRIDSAYAAGMANANTRTVEMLEAASMDGAGFTRTIREIVAPVVMPGIAATSLICFIFSWNELLFARVLTATVAQTAPVFLTGFVTSQGLFLAKVCAAALVVSLPVLAAGFAAQDKLVQGLSLGAVK